MVVDPFKALEPDAPVLRPDRGRTREQPHLALGVGRPGGRPSRARRIGPVTVPIDVYIPRIHVASIETCGCIADFDPVNGQLDFQSPARRRTPYRTVISLVAGIPEHEIRVKSHDIGGGFGGKVPVYPGYVIAIVASLTLGQAR